VPSYRERREAGEFEPKRPAVKVKESAGVEARPLPSEQQLQPSRREGSSSE
jgi:hypothetical protein